VISKHRVSALACSVGFPVSDSGRGVAGAGEGEKRRGGPRPIFPVGKGKVVLLYTGSFVVSLDCRGAPAYRGAPAANSPISMEMFSAGAIPGVGR